MKVSTLTLIAINLSVCYGSAMISKAIKLLGEQGRNHGHDCVLVILEESKVEMSEHQLDDVISKDYPIIINTPSTLNKALFSACSSIVSILPNKHEDSLWLTKLPARHKIIFATDDLTSIMHFPRLKRLPLSEFFIYEKNGTLDADGRYDEFSVHKWEGYHSDGLVEVAMCTGEDFNCNYRGSSSQSMDFHLQTDYKGHEFPAVAFEFFPYSMPNFETQVHNGFEYMIVKVITDALNLKMVVRPPTSGGMWGWQKEDGNYTGLLGDFQHSMAEIGWANLFVTRDRLDIMEFSDWYLSDPSCFLFKQLEPYSGISLLIFPLGSLVWAFGLVALVVMAFFYLLHYLIWPDHFHVGELLLFEVAITFEVSQDSLHHVTTYALRLANGVFILGMFILTAAYAGSLISFFSVKVFPSMPRTIDDMAKFVMDNDLNVHVCCKHINDTMIESSSDSFLTMTEEKRIVPYVEGHFTSALEDTDKGDQIYVYPRNGLEIHRRNNLNVVPYNNLQIMRDCFFPTQIAFGLSLNSPFKSVIDHKLKQLREAGIVDKLVSDGHDMVARIEEEQGGGSNTRNVALELDTLQGVFQTFLIFIGISFVAFIGERYVVPTVISTPLMATDMKAANY